MSKRDEIEAMIARVAIGDKNAFRQVYSDTSAKLFGIILRILDDRSEAEDVLQEVFVKVWHNAGKYQANGFSPMTWLIAIARNAAIDRKRRHGTKTAAAELDDSLPDAGPGPEEKAVQASERARLDACFEELEERRADAVRRAYLEGESYAELAAHFEVPLNTMKTWLRRCLLSLRECLTR
ncbi:MAG: sigma-70 family RNA polymerase sigma factor [Roseovarius sp.]|nr:sigma-70 family RNA polymerase sigma factor [Roseovarius sp.]